LQKWETFHQRGVRKRRKAERIRRGLYNSKTWIQEEGEKDKIGNDAGRQWSLIAYTTAISGTLAFRSAAKLLREL